MFPVRRTQQIGEQKMRRSTPRKCHFRAHKAAPFSAVLAEERTSKGALPALKSEKGKRSCFCCPIHRAGVSTSTMIRVHCSAFTSKYSYLSN